MSRQAIVDARAQAASIADELLAERDLKQRVEGVSAQLAKEVTYHEGEIQRLIRENIGKFLAPFGYVLYKSFDVSSNVIGWAVLEVNYMAEEKKCQGLKTELAVVKASFNPSAQTMTPCAQLSG